MRELLIYTSFAGLLMLLTVVGVVLAARVPRARGQRAGAGAGIVLWLGAVFFMTIRPGSGLGARVNLEPFSLDGRGSALDAVLNTGIFVPLGLLLAAMAWRLIPILAAALAVTLTIEMTQYLTNWGRTADVNDLITNTVGAGLGWIIVVAIRRIKTRADLPSVRSPGADALPRLVLYDKNTASTPD